MANRLGQYLVAKERRLGSSYVNKQGETFIIIEYNNYLDIKIKFEDGTIVKTTSMSIDKGSVMNPNHKTVFGIGFVGVGEFSTINGMEQCARIWRAIIQRGHSSVYKINNPEYADCYVDEEFHNYQNFARFWVDNYYEIEGEKTEIDKDILVKGNRVYSKNTILFCPERINNLFTKSTKSRGALPIGVTKCKSRKGNYVAQCSVTENGKTRKERSYHNTPEEAFNAYKKFKEVYIKQVAEEYKDKIPQKLYDAMYRYEVEIDD